ncbi:uncharacterized protein LOC124689969 [Lolium rigidum]|uniref:uncharacterized protein LOC124689969 n=1 Tax=Lolium rigidum TaxID=89674 RepID=UPI001F5D124F|nr:uncharacterized protein LOC124689969 [Lolium rigidum]
MLRVKRRARGSNEQQENRKRVKEVSSIFSGCKDTVESIKQKLCWKELSQELATKFSASIVSLASFDGDKLHYESTGIVVENSLRNTCILTSSALVSTSDRERRFIYRLKIKLRLPNNQVVDGWIQHYDLPFSMVVVVTRYSPDLHTVCFSNSVKVQRHTDLLALKRCFESGKLMQTHGVPNDDPSKIDSKGSMLSTCKITMDGSGGPLVDLNGNIVGMNDYHDQEGTPYLQGSKIDECLRDVRIRRDEIQRHCWQNFTSAFKHHWEGSSNQNGYSGGSESNNQKQFLSSKPEPQEFTEDVPTPELIDDEHKRILVPWPSDGFTKMVNALLNKDGYPLPAYADGRMRLEGHFEEEFGRDILSEPARKIALKMSRSVVALASFSRDCKVKKRHFACTGVCLDFNGSTSTTRVLTSASLVRTSGDEDKIFDNLEIRVCLPSEECIEGKLEKYDFYYNFAVISFPFRCNRPAMLVDAPQTEVLALGRVFKSGNSMATEGSVTGKKCNFGCEELKISSCKITKAGIGGPLVDFKGNVVGMNFYDTEGTPYLPSKIILKVLRSFDAERPVAAGITRKPNCSWPVPKPYWYYPSEHRCKTGKIKLYKYD